MVKSKRDPMDVAMMWTSITGVTILLVMLSVLSPLAYVWFCGLIGCMAVGFGGLVICANTDSLTGYFVLRAVFEVIGAILKGLVSVS